MLLSTAGCGNMLLCRQNPSFQDIFQGATTHISNWVAPPTWDGARVVQHFGESVFAATILIAFIQAFLALLQYRTNPAGELIVPPGRTIGVESPLVHDMLENAVAVQVPGNETRTPISQREAPSKYSRVLNGINRFLFVFIPLASKTLSTFLASQWHLMHIGFILSLVKFFDAPTSFFAKSTRKRWKNEDLEDQRPEKAVSEGSISHVVVIGDSLAVGLGSVNIFDPNKNQTLDYGLSENLSAPSDLPGPVFPRRLALRLAEYQNQKVHWRSAGVDGGTVPLISKFCLDIIRSECDQGRPPDCVVVLCGINDLKQSISNPLKSVSPRQFREELRQLLCDILRICPRSKVVLPALPVQMFRYDSPLNIFPLGVFLDGIVGFWESQKKAAVVSLDSNDVSYVPLTRHQIEEWYNSKDDEEKMGSVLSPRDKSLIALDGVHPNAKLYRRWAEAIASYMLKG